MQAVVLAAGEGTRMRPLTETVPKPMLPVADKPLVAHTVDGAVSAGADEVVLVVGYGSERVRAHFGDTYRGVPIHYAVQEEQLGTAHAVQAARPHLDGPFVVLNGDNLYSETGLERLFDQGPAVGTCRVPNPSNYGVFAISDGTVTGVVEKPEDPPSDRINTGAYHFPASALESLDVPLRERGEYELTDVLGEVIEEQDVTAVTFDKWLDVGRPWELMTANEWKLSEMERRVDGRVSERAELRGSVVVEEGAHIEPGVLIEGPTLVRSGAHVGPNSYLGGANNIGRGCRIGNGSEVENSVVMDEANVPHLSHVGHSILGDHSNLGAGTQVANLRHDQSDVRLTVKGERVSTGRRKFGVVVGPRAKTGINTSLNAGVTLSAGAKTSPGEVVTRDR